MEFSIEDTDLAKVTNIFNRIIKYYDTTDDWKVEVNKLMQTASNGKIKCFQVFYNSFIEVYELGFVAQALDEKSLTSMYPQYVLKVGKLTSNQCLLILVCCKVVNGGKSALVVDTILSTDVNDS